MRNLQNSGSNFSLSTNKVNFLELKYEQDTSLRDYQIRNKQKIYNAWQNYRSVMLQMPTGTGKTRLFVSIVKDLFHWGVEHKSAVKILILAHRKELIEQIDETLGIKYNQAHGLITSGNAEQRKYPVQVGSVQTLNRRLDKWTDKDFDVIIVDEAHHIKAESYKKIIKQYPNAKILGVTATPYRLNGAGFRPEFDELITSDPVHHFIKRGYLSDYKYYSIDSSSNLQSEINTMKIDKLDGDYLDSEMMNVMDRVEIRAKIVNTYLKYAKGKKGIIYTINKQHNQHIKEQFIAAGVNAEVVTSDTPKDLRDKIVAKFRNGDIDILCNVNIFSEGFDCPDIEFIQLARPTQSLAMFLQQVGRGLRPSANKEQVIILDNVGLYNKFGFPSARRKWRSHFEGKDVIEEISIERPEIELDEEPREVMPIEEGNEPVLLLHNSKDEYSLEDDVLSDDLSEDDGSMHMTEQSYETLLSSMENLESMGIPIPQDWIDRKNEYEKNATPADYIYSTLMGFIKTNFSEDQYSNFEFDSENKTSLYEEREAIRISINNLHSKLNAIDAIINNCSKLGLSMPKGLITNQTLFKKNILECESQDLFLSSLNEKLCSVAKQGPFRAIFYNGELNIEINDLSNAPSLYVECASLSKAVKALCKIDGLPKEIVEILTQNANGKDYTTAAGRHNIICNISEYAKNNRNEFMQTATDEERKKEQIEFVDRINFTPYWVLQTLKRMTYGNTYDTPIDDNSLESDADKLYKIGSNFYELKNYKTAIPFLEQAVAKGSIKALNELAQCYHNGEGVEIDNKKAFKLYEKSANEGNEIGQNNLGAFYHQGVGVKKDHIKALHWTQKSAEQGYAPAQNNLGVMLFGNGFEENSHLAHIWFEKAIEQDFAQAYRGLGICYRFGIGVPRDLHKAETLFIQAMEKGDKKAEDRLIEVREVICM